MLALVGSGASAARAAGQPPERAAPSARSPAAPREGDSLRFVATFDSAWRAVGASLAARGVTAVDWAQVKAELRPRAEAARSADALRAVLRQMLARVGESHFTLIPAGAAPASREERPRASAPIERPTATADHALGTVGLDARVVDGRVLVSRIAADGPAARAGIRPGWEVLAIDGDEWVAPAAPSHRQGAGAGAADARAERMRRLQTAMAVAGALRGLPGTTARVVLRNERGVRLTVHVPRDSARGAVVRLGHLPPLVATLSAARATLAGGGCAGVIHFTYWMPAIVAPFDRAMADARQCDAIVLDLRGNVGGVAGMVMGIAGHFLDAPHALGTLRARGEELRYVANPRRATDAGIPVAPFAGPLAILIDEASVSTSEIFAVAMQSLGRARLFGEPSTGQALPAIVTRLPNGDALMHVVADFVAPDGTRIEGRGAVPDVTVPLRPSDLVAGRDAVLDAALEWAAAAAQDRR